MLAPGELLRSIALPDRALRATTAFRQISLTPHGRSAALLIGARTSSSFVLTVTASTVRPVQLRFPAVPGPAELAAAVDRTIGPPLYYDDVHGTPAWRRLMTLRFAEEISRELGGQV